jgi:hypothetical protein
MFSKGLITELNFFLMVYVYSDTEIYRILRSIETYVWNLKLLKFLIYLLRLLSLKRFNFKIFNGAHLQKSVMTYLEKVQISNL